MTITSNINELHKAAQAVSEACKEHSIWLFIGDMGAGKTTLIKSICEHLGSTDTISSPTFSLVNEYRDSENAPIYHFDVYRLEDPEEALDFGIEEYFDSGALCLIEWPSKIENLIPDRYALISIKNVSDTERELTISFNE